MFSLLSPLTKVLSVATLALLIAFGGSLWLLKRSTEEVGRRGAALEERTRQLDALALDLAASEKALDAQKVEIAKNEALLIANEGRRAALEKRTAVLTDKLNNLGATRYDPPTQLCPSDDHQPSLDDLLDAPLPAELVTWLRDALAQASPARQGDQGDTPGSPDAPLPVTGSGTDDATRGAEPDRGDGR